MSTTLFSGIGVLCRMGEGSGPQAGAAQGDVGEVREAALAVREGTVLAAGGETEVRRSLSGTFAEVDLGGALVLPGWVDAHTHLLFAGTRENEFVQRNTGVTYQEIAASGGGIQSSVRHFRESSDAAILERGIHNLDLALSLGTTTMEVKSGYGLSRDQELRALRLIGSLQQSHAVDVVATYLGAHDIPAAFRDSRAAYVEEVVATLAEVSKEGLAEFCDVFCEEGVFTPEESEHILLAAREQGFALKVHADEFGDTGGSRLAAKLGAVSADHLHGTVESGIDALAQSGVVGVLLPGTGFFLKLRHSAPARRMIEGGLPLALATDFNPGSSMSQSMPLMLTLACLQLEMTPREALVAATVNGAAALSRSHRLGRLRPGYRADFQVLNLPGPDHVAYHYGVSHVRSVYKEGRRVF